MTVYLAGGINGLSDADAKGWREIARAGLLEDTLDPMRRDYRGIEDLHHEEIVKGDLSDIANSDVLLAYCPRPSWGTAMEIVYAARIIGIPVVVVAHEPVSPWLRYHADEIWGSLDEAIVALNEAFEDSRR